MALELQLNTAKAASELQKATQAVDRFSASLNKLGQAAGAAKGIAQSLSSIKGVNPQAVASLEKMANALNKLKAIGSIDKVIQALTKLQSLNVGKVATAITNVAAALAKIRIPPGLQNTLKLLQQLAPAAQKAAGSMAQLAGAVQRLRVPAGLTNINAQLQKLTSSARTAAGSMKGFGSATSAATGVLAGFGIALGGVGLAQFIRSAFEATRTIDGFKSAMTAFTDKGLDAEKQLKRIADTTNRLGIALEPSITSFKKFAAATLSAGVDLETTNRTFENFQTVAAALKLSGDQVSRVFLALEQTFSKGRVASEELRRQLGEVIPGAFQAAADAANMTGAEFSKALQKGQIPAELMIKLGDELAKKYSEAAKVASTTFVAAVTRMSNSVFKLQEAFGRGFGDAAKDSINALADAMSNPGFLSFAENLGTVAGTLVSFGAKVAKTASQFPALSTVIATVIGLGLAGTVVKWIAALTGVTKVLAIAAVGFRTVAGAVAAWGGIAAVVAVVSKAIRGMAIGMAVLGGGALLTGVAIAAAGAAIGALLAVITSGVSAEEAMAKVTETLGQAWEFAKSAAETFLKPLGLLGDESGQVAGSMGDTAKSTAKAADGFGDASASAEDMAAGLGAIDRNAGGAAQGMGNAATASRDLAKGTSDAANATSRAAGTLGDAAGNANEVAQAYRNAARAARELAQAQSSLQSGVGGGVVGQAGGGMAGVGPVIPVSNMSIFKNAPRLAGGTSNTSDLGGAGSAPTGGIPAILHPNEAVVPLAGGGSIPVSMPVSGGGTQTAGAASGSSAIASRETLRIIELLNDIELELGKNTTVLTTFSTNYVELTRISHTWYQDISNKLVMVAGAIDQCCLDLLGGLQGLELKLASVGGGGGGGGGFGGGGFGGGGSIGDFNEFTSLQNASQSAAESLIGKPWIQIGTGQGPRAFLSPQDRATEQRAATLSRNAQLALHQAMQATPGVKVKKESTSLAGGSNFSYSVPAEIYSQLPTQVQSLPNVRKAGGGGITTSLGGGSATNAFGGDPMRAVFAKGTANTSDSGIFRGGSTRSASGGAAAILHPNEAVIPLDGNRKVPVNLNLNSGNAGAGDGAQPRPGFLSMMEREEKKMAQRVVDNEGFGRSGGRGGENRGQWLNVQMNVVTPDANSFMRNKDQITQELAAKLTRSRSQFGQKTVADDPTTFLRKKDRENV